VGILIQVKPLGFGLPCNTVATLLPLLFPRPGPLGCDLFCELTPTVGGLSLHCEASNACQATWFGLPCNAREFLYSAIYPQRSQFCHTFECCYECSGPEQHVTDPRV
jgi:hypothetical protein